MTGQPDRLNVLQASIDNNPSTTSVQFLYELRGVADGTRLCIGLEEMHVVTVSGQGAGSTATVVRAVNGSSIAAHSANDQIQVAPQFSDFKVSKYINTALDQLSSDGLFQIKTKEFEFIPTQAGYNLDVTDLIDVWRVSYDYPGPMQDWPVITPDRYHIDQAANTTDFPSGIKLVIQEGGYPGHNVRVAYRAPYTHLSALTDNVLTVSGLHTEAHDLPSLAACIQLLAGREVKRSFLNRQPEPRRQQEVPPGAANQSMVPLLKLYKDRCAQESRRLKRRYPGAV